MPGATSSDDDASTAHGRTAAIASATFSGPRPPARTMRPSPSRGSRLVASASDPPRPRGGRGARATGSPSPVEDRLAAAHLPFLDRVHLVEVGVARAGLADPHRDREAVSGTGRTRSAARGLSGASTKPSRSAPASAATATSSSRVSPQTLTSGRESSSASFAAGIRRPHQRRADEDRVRAGELGCGALRARLDSRLRDRRSRSCGHRATSSSCAARSIAKVERSRALTPTTGASSAIARASSAASCASTSVSRPRPCGLEP